MNYSNKFLVFQVVMFCANGTQYSIKFAASNGDLQERRFELLKSCDYIKLRQAFETNYEYSPFVLEELRVVRDLAAFFTETEPLDSPDTPWKKFLFSFFIDDAKQFYCDPERLLQSFKKTLSQSQIRILDFKTSYSMPDSFMVNCLRFLAPALLAHQTNIDNPWSNFFLIFASHYIPMKTLFEIAKVRPITFDNPTITIGGIYAIYAALSGSWHGFVSFAMVHIVAIQILQWWLDGWAFLSTMIHVIFSEPTYTALSEKRLLVHMILNDNKEVTEKRLARIKKAELDQNVANATAAVIAAEPTMPAQQEVPDDSNSLRATE